uniref:Tetratricopeptide repeat domain 21B n=1 Tax=Rousettus aegyptiacus TaxID=9407 RepID=A0A7J8JND5_ROUAE|nr:tetratricopeptide repeat domain 21B [Rousettus aegyptiacus]
MENSTRQQRCYKMPSMNFLGHLKNCVLLLLMQI